jgi:tetratricopeptide (TPR) repeat protein
MTKMIRNWLMRLLRWLSKQSPPPLPQPPPPTPPPLVAALEEYRQALEALGTDPHTLLAILLSRDRAEATWQQTQPPPTDQAGQLLALDKRLRKQTADLSLDELPTWRQTLRPPDAHWWWFLDQRAKEREEEKDLPWVLLTGTFMMVTLSLATDIVKRLWDGAPDTLSVFGTLLTLLLTGSPLTQRGREFVQWTLKRIPRLKPRYRAEAMATMAFLALVLVLVGRLAIVPWLAKRYNDRGYAAVRAGNLTTAQRNFRRAVALDADLAVGYYHLANVYEEIARPDEAITWYQKALEHDLDLGAAYNNLGRLYILQDDAERAVQILQAGLSHTTGESETDLVTRYRLLSNLGRAYYVLEQPARARDALKQAIALESQLDAAYRSAVPHYYLALAYEALEQPDDALQQWEDSLRYLEADDPEQSGWEETIRTHLDKLRREEEP